MSGRYLLSKVGQAIVTIVLLIILNFILFRMMPGSPERILGRNPNVSAEAIAATRERWGLDKPVFPDQLVAYIVATANGDLGFSFVYRGLPVADVLADRIWPTRDPVRSRRDHRDHPRRRARRVHRMETRRPRRPPRERRIARVICDAVLPDRDDVTARLRASGSAGSRPTGCSRSAPPTTVISTS